MGWLVLGHVASVNSAITTCQPQPTIYDPRSSLKTEQLGMVLNQKKEK